MASSHSLKSLLFLVIVVVFLDHGMPSVHASMYDEDYPSLPPSSPSPSPSHPPSHSPIPPSSPSPSHPPSHSPNGTTGELTPLQKHVSFFDRNNDGVIYPSETYKGFRALGAGVSTSLAAAAFIHAHLGPKTNPGKGLEENSFLLPIYIENIKNGKHASDSGAYDSEGRFVEAKFEEIFTKHAKKDPDSLTKDELKEMLRANVDPGSRKGVLAAMSEWLFLYKFFKDKDGLLQKDTVRAMYDGSLFHEKAGEFGSSFV